MIFLLVGVIFVALVVWAFVGPLVRQARWGGLAKALRLTPGPDTRGGFVVIKYKGPFPSQPLNGVRGEIPVSVGTRRETYYDSENRAHTRTITYVRARMSALGLGLRISKAGWFGTMVSRVAGGAGLEIGQRSLDNQLKIQATERDAALRMLRIPYVIEALGWACNSGFELAVDDLGVRFEKRGIEYRPSRVGPVLDQAVALSRRLAAARAETMVDGLELARQERWAQTANELGMALTAHGFEGRHKQMFVEVKQHRRGEQWWTAFTVRYDRSLGLSLRLTRQSGLASLGELVGLQDIEIGDRRFDERFIVKGAPTESVRQLLTPEVRAHLIELQERATHLEVEDQGVSAMVSWRVMDPDHLKWGVATVAATGAAIAGVTPVEVGPFRGR